MGQTDERCVIWTVCGENAEDILGQFYCAFGQGAGSIRIARSAIAAFRRRYFDPIKSAPGPWKAVAPNVLSFVAQVGRLAALFATQAGRTAINSADFARARQMVESSVHRSADASNILIAGPHCPGLPDEINGVQIDRVDDGPEPLDSVLDLGTQTPAIRH